MIRYKPEEKLEIIHLVEHSELPVKQTLAKLQVPRSTFYDWYRRYQELGPDGLKLKTSRNNQFWNHIPDPVRKQIVQLALEHPEESPRQITCRFIEEKSYFVSESSVYRILKGFDLIESPAFEVITAREKFDNPTKRINEMWQTGFTQFLVVDWGWYYLSTVLDDFSRYILAYTLSPTMNAQDVEDTLNIAMEKAEIDKVKVYHKPRLLSDNGPAYHSADLARFLTERRIRHIHGSPYNPMTHYSPRSEAEWEGKIESYHHSMKNIVNMQNYFLPGKLESQIASFVIYYNNQQYHESLDNLTPADVYFGRTKEVLTKREKIKRRTMQQRRLQNLQPVAV